MRASWRTVHPRPRDAGSIEKDRPERPSAPAQPGYDREGEPGSPRRSPQPPVLLRMRFAQLVRLAFLPAAISIASTPLFAQGDTGFLRGVGKWDLAMTYTNDSYDEFWVGDDKVSDPAVGEVTRETWSIYSAYGLREDMDLVLSAAYVEASSDGAGGFSDENELQDWSFGIKWAFWKQRVGSGEASMLFAPSIKDPLTGYEDNA